MTLADWHQRFRVLPPAGRQAAAHAGADVAVGQVHVVTASAGRLALDPAVASFLRGFELARLLASVIIAAAGLLGFAGLRQLRRPG